MGLTSIWNESNTISPDATQANGTGLLSGLYKDEDGVPTNESRYYVPHGAAYDILFDRSPELLMSGPAGTGKAQPLDAEVMTPQGPREMRYISVGDEVLTPFGTSATVLQVHPQGVQDVYRVEFSCGGPVECTAEHLWEVRYKGGGHKGGQKVRDMSAVLTTSEISENYLLTAERRSKYWLPPIVPAALAPKPIPIHPYLLGVLLGDGYMRRGEISFATADEQIVQEVSEVLGPEYKLVATTGKYHYRISWEPSKKRNTRSRPAKRGYISYHKAAGKWMARARTPDGGAKYLGLYLTEGLATQVLERYEGETHSQEELHPYSIWNSLRFMGLLGTKAATKFVPSNYLHNSEEVRLALLQGLLDTDGTVDRKTGTPSFCSISPQLVEAVAELVHSLGGSTNITTRRPKGGQLAYQCWIRHNDSRRLFRLKRKKALCKERTKYPARRFIRTIEKVRQAECQCITISDPRGLYLTNHYTPTHNSRSILEKLHLCAEKYAGMRALIVRKTRASLTQSGLVTFEEKVVPVGHPILSGANRAHRQSYLYPNGSEIVIGGMDKATRILSTEYELIYVQEAIELTEDEWENLTTRLDRPGVMPYNQLIADTNPDSQYHWLYQRCMAGKCKLVESRHEDNPAVTKTYLARLENLTGVRLQRFRYGKWVTAEGIVYEEWDRSVHVVDRFDIPKDWPRYWTIDFGYTAPFVFQAWAVDPDGRLYRFKEIYHTGKLVSDHAEDIKWWMARDKPPVAIICDHDAEDRATLERHLGMKTLAAHKDVSPGIQAVSMRLRDPGDGKRRLYFLRDSLISRDPKLEEAKKPCCTEEEPDSYIWNTSGNRKKGEEPVKENDHGLDATRYMVAYIDKIDGDLDSQYLGLIFTGRASGWNPKVGSGAYNKRPRRSRRGFGR